MGKMSEFFKNRPNDFFSNLKVVTCFIEYKDTILFLQRSKSLIAPLKWAIPGGKVEKEESNFAALKREIFEELALKIDNREKISLINNVFVRHAFADYELILYRWITHEKPAITLNPNEHVNFIWSPFLKILNLDLIEGQLEAFKLVYENDYSFIRDYGRQ
ncbi:Uncharacterized protein PRO82_000612 [Candidatus Protochlamydia amoebophila]|nr:Uncharacterized protein [Candidatus Protochlamydia amoebophila]